MDRTANKGGTRGAMVAPPLSNGRERFTSRELDEVLAHYELGEVSSVREVALGTPTSPKALVESVRGKVLLKRRARGVDAPGLVSFSHRLVLGLLRAGVCVPPLIGTRSQNNSMVQIDDRVYELFVFLEGNNDPKSAVSSQRSGMLLGEMYAAFDQMVADSEALQTQAPREPAIIDLSRIERSGVDDEIVGPVRGILERAQRWVSGSMPLRLVHGDWHPGNVIFRNDEPVGVCDFDNARLGSREREVAQGLAQFSLDRGNPGDPPARWNAQADLYRLAGHWHGYLARGDRAIDRACIVGLMPGVLIEEALGSNNPEIIWAVVRKAHWLEDHAEQVRAALN